MNLAGRTHVLNSNVQDFDHYVNELSWLPEQGPERFTVERWNAFSASRKFIKISVLAYSNCTLATIYNDSLC